MKFIATIIAASLFVGCSSSRPRAAYVPQQTILVDTKGVDMAKYYQDEAECKALASRVEGQNASAAFWSGLSIGAAQASANLKATKDTALRSCLRGRNYVTLF